MFHGFGHLGVAASMYGIDSGQVDCQPWANGSRIASVGKAHRLEGVNAHQQPRVSVRGKAGLRKMTRTRVFSATGDAAWLVFTGKAWSGEKRVN
jgi:hypothetical protein